MPLFRNRRSATNQHGPWRPTETPLLLTEADIRSFTSQFMEESRANYPWAGYGHFYKGRL